MAAVVGQVVGAVMVAPLLFKLLKERAVMAVVMLLYAWVAVVAARLGPLGRREMVGEEGPGLWQALLLGWRVLGRSRAAFLAMIYMTGAMTLLKVVVVLAPHYVKEVLGIATENVVFVMAPAAVGAGLGLLLTPMLGRLIRIERAVVVGFGLLVVALLALGLVVQLRGVIVENLDLGIGFVERKLGVSSVITLTILLAAPVGLAGTMVLVACRTILNREAPLEAQARVFATQSAVADAVSLLPALALGGMADLLGARYVLVAATLVTLAAMGYVLGRAPALMERLRALPL
jgi:MFS-type transporter involved in bile tolerance (Atg22 family)